MQDRRQFDKETNVTKETRKWRKIGIERRECEWRGLFQHNLISIKFFCFILRQKFDQFSGDHSVNLYPFPFLHFLLLFSFTFYPFLPLSNPPASEDGSKQQQQLGMLPLVSYPSFLFCKFLIHFRHMLHIQFGHSGTHTPTNDNVSTYHMNITECIRHQYRKTTVSSCHRCPWC